MIYYRIIAATVFFCAQIVSAAESAEKNQNLATLVFQHQQKKLYNYLGADYQVSHIEKLPEGTIQVSFSYVKNPHEVFRELYHIMRNKEYGYWHPTQHPYRQFQGDFRKDAADRENKIRSAQSERTKQLRKLCMIPEGPGIAAAYFDDIDILVVAKTEQRKIRIYARKLDECKRT